MDFVPGSESSLLQDDVEILRQELLALAARREKLKRDIAREEELIELEETSHLQPDRFDTEEEKEEQKLSDILMAYRLAGVTLLKPDVLLDGPKNIGIRFETFSNAKYHEPYYVFLTESTANEENQRQAGHDGDDEDDEQFGPYEDNLDPKMPKLSIFKHTIPHWIPTAELARRYLRRDISTFTRRISEYLQSYVNRREQIEKAVSYFSKFKPTIPPPPLDPTEATPTPSKQPRTEIAVTCTSMDAAVTNVILQAQWPLIVSKTTKKGSKSKRRKTDEEEEEEEEDQNAGTRKLEKLEIYISFNDLISSVATKIQVTASLVDLTADEKPKRETYKDSADRNMAIKRNRTRAVYCEKVLMMMMKESSSSTGGGGGLVAALEQIRKSEGKERSHEEEEERLTTTGR